MTDDDRRARAVIPESVTGTAERYRYSPGIVVPAGDLLFVSGQVGRDATGTVVLDPERQFATAFENLEAVLAAAGTTLAHVVELTTYHTAMEHLAVFAEVKARFLATAPYPAWSAIGVRRARAARAPRGDQGDGDALTGRADARRLSRWGGRRRGRPARRRDPGAARTAAPRRRPTAPSHP